MGTAIISAAIDTSGRGGCLTAFGDEPILLDLSGAKPGEWNIGPSGRDCPRAVVCDFGPDTQVTERTQDMGDNLVPNGFVREISLLA